MRLLLTGCSGCSWNECSDDRADSSAGSGEVSVCGYLARGEYLKYKLEVCTFFTSVDRNSRAVCHL